MDFDFSPCACAWVLSQVLWLLKSKNMQIQVKLDLWLTDNLPGVHKLRFKEWITGSSSHKRSDQIRVYGKCFENIFCGNSEPQSVVGLPCFHFSKHWHRISRLWTPSAAFHIIYLPHTSSFITFSGTTEHRHCYSSRTANTRCTVCPQ